MLSVGIVGLPNVGKSTLFRALTKKRVAISNRPFTTINPNIAVVQVPDYRIEKLKEISNWKEVVPAMIEFIDIAGLVKNAHQGEGLGNQFLSHIRNTDAIIHLVRVFENQDITHIQNKIDPAYDIEIVNLELELAKIEKPTLYVFNVSENQISNWQIDQNIKNLIGNSPYIILSANLELILSELNENEKNEYIKELNLKSELDNLVKSCYNLLNLISFFTIKGKNQLRAWEISRNTSIIEAAGKIHSDFKEKFIRSEIIDWQTLLKFGSWLKAKEMGFIKLVGRDYIVQDGDVIEIKI